MVNIYIIKKLTESGINTIKDHVESEAHLNYIEKHLQHYFDVAHKTPNRF